MLRPYDQLLQMFCKISRLYSILTVIARVKAKNNKNHSLKISFE
ncbi:hypothetical protein GCWU000246_01145 [Jonquetella anthropi E3_33 E1]|nr:hypothetical protein GCWU000246_01145 [Jonquetella anthropi E3_33 E1]